MTQIVSLSFFRFDGVISRMWALYMMGAARGAMSRVPDIGFWKLCGSGSGEGFTPIPNTAVYAILATWPDLETAQNRTGQHPIFQRYHQRATEAWSVFLTPTSVKGEWSGQQPFLPEQAATPGPLAALTRATVKPSVAMKFWQQVPDISTVIGADPNVAFKIGIGEVPLLHQITFSIWPDKTTMAEFARKDGPHARAITAVRAGDWFREELYARFAVVDDAGSWGGQSPLDRLEGQT